MVSMRPYISVIVPTYNRGHFIHDAIHSALDQEYDNYEIVVVDDGSEDNTQSVVRNISDPRLRFVAKAHTGAPDTRNYGVKSAQGDYILWLDSDDLLGPDVLDLYARVIKEYKHVDVVYGDLEIFDKLGNRRALEYRDHWTNSNLFASLIKGNIIANGGSLVRKNLFREVGLFDTNYSRAHDYEFWSRAASTAKFKHVGVATYHWLWHGCNVSAENQNIDRSYEANIVHRLAARIPLEQLFPDLEWTDFDATNAEAYARIAAYLLRWKSDSKAREYVERALSCNADNALALTVERRLRSRKANQEGQAAYAEKDHKKALDRFKLAIRVDPGNHQAYNNQAVVYALLGDRANAMTQCAAALKIAPNDLDLYYNVAKILISIKQEQSAASLCAAVLEQDPFAAPMRALLLSINTDTEPLNSKIPHDGYTEAREFYA